MGTSIPSWRGSLRDLHDSMILYENVANQSSLNNNSLCSTSPDSCPIPQACYQVSDEIASCACITTYGYTGIPECTTLTSNTIFLFCYFSIFLFLLTIGFLIEMYLLSEYIKFQFFQKKRFREIPLGLSFVTVILCLITMIIAIILLILELVGISNPTLISELKGGIRVSYLESLRNYFVATLETLFVAIVILHIGSFLEIAYHTRNLRPLKDIARVRRVTLVCGISFVIVAFALVGEDLAVATASFNLAVTVLLIVLMIVSARILSTELDMHQKSGKAEDLERIKRSVLEISIIVLFALFCSVCANVINLIPPYYHRPFWKISAILISIFVATFLPITLAHYANMALLKNFNELVIKNHDGELTKKRISKLTSTLLFRKRTSSLKQTTKQNFVNHGHNQSEGLPMPHSEENRRDEQNDGDAIQLT